MNEKINSNYQSIDIQSSQYLTIAQIKHVPQDTFHHISIHEAMSLEQIIIQEVSDSGNVNNVLIINESEDSVFIMDGDLLKGAKQNRVLNTSILLPPNSKSIIPVSCVEQGRWSHRTSSFSPSNEIAAKNIRMGKHDDIYSKSETSPLHMKHDVNQGKVWDNVHFCADISGSLSATPTGSHSDMFHFKRKDFQSYVGSFKMSQDSNGLVYFINGKLMGCEIFNRKSIYHDYFDKILISIGFEIDSQLKGYSSSRLNSLFSSGSQFSNDDISTMLSSLFLSFDNSVEGVDYCKGIALGDEKRFKEKNNMFYSLMFDNNTIHKSLLVSN